MAHFQLNACKYGQRQYLSLLILEYYLGFLELLIYRLHVLYARIRAREICWYRCKIKIKGQAEIFSKLHIGRKIKPNLVPWPSRGIARPARWVAGKAIAFIADTHSAGDGEGVFFLGRQSC